MSATARAAVLLGALSLLAAACGSDPQGPAEAATAGEARSAASADSLTVQVASYDLAVGHGERVTVGLLTPDRKAVDFGTVPLRFTYLGTDPDAPTPAPGPTATGTYLPVPGRAPQPASDVPVAIGPADGVGVYQARVDLDRAGFWQVAVALDLEGYGHVAGRGEFLVHDHHLVPTVGDPAPAVENLTLDDLGAVPATAIDSRATDGTVPDPDLHRTTVARALADHRPVVAVLSTPVYCVSQFCGPVTELVADLERRFGDGAAFVHVEVWRDYEEAALNDAYDAWVNEGDNGHEPWIFLVDGQGTIVQRWDNVPDEQALVSGLQALIGTG